MIGIMNNEVEIETAEMKNFEKCGRLHKEG
jgi:hypothetical protein